MAVFAAVGQYTARRLQFAAAPHREVGRLLPSQVVIHEKDEAPL